MVDLFTLKLANQIEELAVDYNYDLDELIKAGVELLKGSVGNADKRVD